MDEDFVKSVYELSVGISKEELCRRLPDCGYEKLRDDVKAIILEPNESILAHTEEFIGGTNRIKGDMACRSSYGRIGIAVCMCAGLGDVGYYDRWTFEIKNKNELNTLVLFVGEPIAQIYFYKFDSPVHGNYSDKGHYQNIKYHGGNIIDVNRLLFNWKPENMLPKLYISAAESLLKKD